MKELQDSPDEIKKDFSADSFEQKLHTDFKNQLRLRASSCVRLKSQQKHRAQPRIRAPYSQLEDEQIITGIKKHGFGCWSNILQDKYCMFNVNRTPDSINSLLFAFEFLDYCRSRTFVPCKTQKEFYTHMAVDYKSCHKEIT